MPPQEWFFKWIIPSPPVAFRSRGLGIVKVIAKANGVSSTPRQIDLAWPLGLFATTLIAGAIGGLLRWYEAKKKNKKKKDGNARVEPVLVAALVGALVGLTIVVAMALGLQRSPTPSLVFTEAGAALVGFLAGYAGTRLLGPLTSRLFGSAGAGA